MASATHLAPLRFVVLAALWVATGWPVAHAYESLGTGSLALVRGDATDPQNNGDEICVVNGSTPLQCGFEATFSGNNEPQFGGGEGAFNVFDNSVASGNAKWCCDAPSAGTDDPATADDETGSLYVQAEFAEAIVLHAFTLAIGNDIQPARDADIFKLQGSNDGLTYTDIYSYSNDGTSPFTAANQVLLFRSGVDYALPPAYRIFRYRAFSTVGGTQHHLNEIELFQSPTTPQTIPTSGTCSLHDAILAANRGLPVSGCVSGSYGADTIVLNSDVVLTAPDTATVGVVNHAQHTTAGGGGVAGLPDVTDALTLIAGTGSSVVRDASLGCVEADPASFRLLTARADLTLEGLTLENGCIAPAGFEFTQGGGLWAIDSALTLRDTVWRNHQARGRSNADGSSVPFPVDGGAVWTINGSFAVQSSRFEGNAVHGGDGVNAGAIATGGGLFGIGSLAAFSDVIFEDNLAESGSGTGSGSAGGPATGGAAFLSLQGGPAPIERLIVRGNTTRGGSGVSAGAPATGAFFLNGGPAQLRDALFESNLVEGGGAPGQGGPASGGGFYGNLLLGERITLTDNVAHGGSGQGGGSADGGGMVLTNATPATLRNLTLSGNRAEASGGISAGSARGGGLYVNSGQSVLLQHVTAIGNEAIAGSGQVDGTARGAGLAVAGPVELGHALLQQNIATDGNFVQAGDDCRLISGSVTSLGYNRLQAVPGGCGAAHADDLIGVTVPVAALEQYGCVDQLPDGSCLPTVALSSGSALAVDAGTCAVSGASDDARALTRPQDIASYGDGSDDCDIGAFEASDGDGDAALDTDDNCPAAANASQADADGDGLGDACDACRSSYAPQFSASGPFALLSGAAPETVVGDVDAENGGLADEGIAYAVTGGSGQAFATVGGSDGRVTLLTPAPAPGSYTLQVSATDCAGSSSTTVTLEVSAVSIFGNGFEG